MYLADIYTVIANLTGMPAMTLPIGRLPQGQTTLPVGLQVMTDTGKEALMFEVGASLQTLAKDANRRWKPASSTP